MSWTISQVRSNQKLRSSHFILLFLEIIKQFYDLYNKINCGRGKQNPTIPLDIPCQNETYCQWEWKAKGKRENRSFHCNYYHYGKLLWKGFILMYTQWSNNEMNVKKEFLLPSSVCAKRWPWAYDNWSTIIDITTVYLLDMLAQ